MSRFNLIDEPWIPVRFPDGRRDELGIQDTLLRAKEIATIEDPSPLVTAALHRFLLAVLYRALMGPTDIEKAKALFREGFPSAKIEDYLQKWRPRFWLFDEKYPFGQIPGFEPKNMRAWTVLAAEHNADNAKVLFDHVRVDLPGQITAAAGTRWLLATQTFSVSCGKSELSHTKDAPSAGAVMAIPIGRSLMDTLIFCLVPQNRAVMQSDLPLWEKEPESLDYLKTMKGKERAVAGYVDLLTWRTRAILFRESSEISELAFASGVADKESLEVDPMLGYKIVETKEKVRKRVSIHLEDDKGFWRDFDSLLPDDSLLAPKVIDNAIRLSRLDGQRFPRGVMILGQRHYPPRPNIAYWRREFFILPEAIIGNRSVRNEIRSLLISAEREGEAINDACKSFAKNILSHGVNKDKRKVEKKDILNFVKQTSVLPHYWSILEAKFHEILKSYTINKNPDEIELEWLRAVRDALDGAWKLHRASVSTSDAWAIRAMIVSERVLRYKLKELNDRIRRLEPQTEAA